jgi:hypothetical protein
VEILFASRPTARRWSPSINLSRNMGARALPSMALRLDGSLRVVWRDGTLGNTDILFPGIPPPGATEPMAAPQGMRLGRSPPLAPFDGRMGKTHSRCRPASVSQRQEGVVSEVQQTGLGRVPGV